MFFCAGVFGHWDYLFWNEHKLVFLRANTKVKACPNIIRQIMVWKTQKTSMEDCASLNFPKNVRSFFSRNIQFIRRHWQEFWEENKLETELDKIASLWPAANWNRAFLIYNMSIFDKILHFNALWFRRGDAQMYPNFFCSAYREKSKFF